MMKKTKYVFFIFWAISLITFIPSIGAGFVFDFLGWQNAFSKGSFASILNCFGYNENQQVLHFVFYSFYQLFHISGFPWYFFFCTLHAINAFLLYLLTIRLMKQWGGTIQPLLAFLGAVAFLIHPYAVEAVVWKVCVHYLMSMMAIMLIFLSFLKYIESGKNQMILTGGLVFILSLFTLEISFITPLAITCCGFITYLISENKKKVLHSTIRFGGLLWLLLAGYLVLNKITLGHLVGHYGEKTHFHFDFILIAATEIKFFIKHIFYARFYSYNAKNILFDKILSNPEVTFFCITAILSICILYFIKLRRISAEWHVVFFAVMASLLYILPVSNLYFYHLQIGMNDRYSYIAVSFLMLAIVAALTKCSGGIRYMVIAIILLINIFYQQTTLKYWHDSTLVLKSLKDDFRWHDSPMVFVLNSPDNFEGIVMASISNVPSGIEELIDFQTSHPFTGKMIDVLQYNMTTMNDGVKIEQIGPMQLKVSFNQWGNWWHRYGFGATSYENEYYKVETLDYPYLLTFKSFPAGSTIIYEDGMKWKEFHFMETK